MGQFVVVGLGNFGYNVAIALTELGHQVLVIDSDNKKIEQIKDKVTQTIVADVRERETLSEFISKDVDVAIVGLGDRMEANTLAVLYLKELGVKKIVVKVISDDHAQIMKSIGATDLIYPEKEVAFSLAKRLTSPNLIEHIPLAPEYSIVEIATPDNFIGKTLAELQLRTKYNVEVIAIKDVILDTIHLVPRADIKVNPDSALIIIGKKVDINKMKV